MWQRIGLGASSSCRDVRVCLLGTLGLSWSSDSLARRQGFFFFSVCLALKLQGKQRKEWATQGRPSNAADHAASTRTGCVMCHELLVFLSAEKTVFENCTPFQRLRILFNLHTCLVLTHRIDGRAVTPACMVIRRAEFAIWRMCERWIRATAIHDKMTKRYLWCCCTNGCMNLRMHIYTHIWFKCVCIDVVPCFGKSCTNIASIEICIYVNKIRLWHKYTCHAQYVLQNECAYTWIIYLAAGHLTRKFVGTSGRRQEFHLSKHDKAGLLLPIRRNTHSSPPGWYL